jgi:hypothetical protein
VISEQRCAVSQGAQRGQAGDRQRRCGGKADSIGQYGDAPRRHRGAFRPAELVHQRDNTCASRRAGPIRRLPQHNATDVLAGDPALLVIAERAQLAAIKRKRLHRNQRLMQARCWLPHLPQFDRRLAVGCIDQCKHLRPSVPQRTQQRNTMYLVWRVNGVLRKPLEFESTSLGRPRYDGLKNRFQRLNFRTLFDNSADALPRV